MIFYLFLYKYFINKISLFIVHKQDGTNPHNKANYRILI